MRVTLTPAELLVAAQVGCMCRVSALNKGLRDAHGYAGKDPFDVHIRGAAGELAFAKATGRYWPMSINDFKGGPADFPPNIEIKTLAKHHYDLFLRSNVHDDRRYVLVTGERMEFFIHGWIWGYQKEECGVSDDFGNGREAGWRIKQADLYDIERLEADDDL